MRRVALLFFTQLLLWVLVSQVNHALSGFHLYLFAGALFVTYAALMLPLGAGITVSLLGGLLCDANLPLAPHLPRIALALAHTHVLLFLVAHAVIFYLRDRLPRDETTARVLVALFTNLGLFLLFSVIHTRRLGAATDTWLPIIADLVFSQICLALVSPWFFSLQERSLILAGVQRESLAKSP